MVEVRKQIWEDPSFGNGGGNYSPEYTVFEKGDEKDILELKIGNL